jgi:ribose-phosphate pyrophosphokinase
MAVIGDVKDKIAIILDDMADTAGTLVEASAAVMARGASEVHACCSHAVLSGPAIDRICDSYLKSVVVTDTIPLTGKAISCEKIQAVEYCPAGGRSDYPQPSGRFGHVAVCVTNTAGGCRQPALFIILC